MLSFDLQHFHELKQRTKILMVNLYFGMTRLKPSKTILYFGEPGLKMESTLHTRYLKLQQEFRMLVIWWVQNKFQIKKILGQSIAGIPTDLKKKAKD